MTEEEDEEPEVKPKSKGRGNARNAVSKAGRPRRSTAGRGKGEFLTNKMLGIVGFLLFNEFILWCIR